MVGPLLRSTEDTKALAARSSAHATVLLVFLAERGTPWWGLLIAGVVLSLAEMILNPSVPYAPPDDPPAGI